MVSSLHSSLVAATTSALYLPCCHSISSLSLKPSFPSPLSSTQQHPSLKNPKFQYKSNQTPNHPPSSPLANFLVRSSMASSTQNTDSISETKPFSVLFVCLGNICRSPAAEGVFKDVVKRRGLESRFNIDSAGTIDYHEGNPADSRMRAAAKRRGVEITSLSRPIKASDFSEFDLILAMDEQNKADILKAFSIWKRRGNLPADADEKVKLMCSYCKKYDETEVPDPYYGGAKGFEKVLDLLEDSCESLLDSIIAEKGQAAESS